MQSWELGRVQRPDWGNYATANGTVFSLNFLTIDWQGMVDLFKAIGIPVDVNTGKLYIDPTGQEHLFGKKFKRKIESFPVAVVFGPIPNRESSESEEIAELPFPGLKKGSRVTIVADGKADILRLWGPFKNGDIDLPERLFPGKDTGTRFLEDMDINIKPKGKKLEFTFIVDEITELLIGQMKHIQRHVEMTIK